MIHGVYKQRSEPLLVKIDQLQFTMFSGSMTISKPFSAGKQRLPRTSTGEAVGRFQPGLSSDVGIGGVEGTPS